MEIESLDDLDLGKTVKLCVYGTAGSGKTTLIGTLPGKILLLSAESGLLPLKRLPKERKKDIDVFTLTTFEQAIEAYDRLKKEHVKYDWIAIDSISEIADAFLRHALKSEKDPRKAYGNLSQAVGGLFRDLRDLPTSIYMAAKEERIKDDATGRVTYEPSFPGGQLARDVPHLYDELFRLGVTTDGKRVLICHPDGQCKVKDRSGVLDQFEEPDLGIIARKISEASTED